VGGRAAWEPQPRNANHQADDDGFEYDPAKSASNKERHGIDFEEAKALWADSRRTRTPSEFIGEPRMVTTAEYNGKMFTAVYTERDRVIRIISVRRARPKEVRLYESKDD
jgi:uncharacterized DUF497 family protein